MLKQAQDDISSWDVAPRWTDKLNRSVGKRAQTLIRVSIGVVIVAILVTAVMDILRIRRDVIGEAGRSTSNLARTLEEHSRLTFEGVFQALGTAIRLVDRGPTLLDYENPETRETLRHIIDATPYLLDIKIVDRTGRLVSEFVDQGKLGKIVSDKSAIASLRDNPSKKFHISMARSNKAYANSVIYVSVNLPAPDGIFRGVVVGVVDVNHFDRFYAAINVGVDGAIKLVRRDGIILTRRPTAFIGTSVAKGPLFMESIPANRAGTIDVISATDGKARILSYRALSNFPVVVVVSTSKDQVLAPWRQRTGLTVLLAVIVLLPIFGLMFLLFHANRSKAAAAAERSRIEAQFLNSIEHVKEGVAFYDANDRLVICNSTYRAQWDSVAPIVIPGVTFEEILREAVYTRNIAVPAGEEEHWISNFLDRHGALDAPEEIYCGGRWRQIHQNRLPDGGMVQITPDISDLKDRERDWRIAMEEAEFANTTKSRFLEAANHDLRQPLQAMKLLSHVLGKRAEDMGQDDIFKNMTHALDAMEAVLNSLSEIGKFESGRIVPHDSTFNLANLFQRMEAQFLLQAQSCGLEMIVVRSTLSVRSDFDLLSRILENLITNAIRYTETGRVLVGARRKGTSACIEVWDTGSGIPEDQLKNIFEEFYQLANPARDRQKGLGLGLSIVDRIAKLIDARIEVRSTPGKGSMFAITVPIGTPEEIKASPVEPETKSNLQLRSSVLVVDDDESVLYATRLALESLGAEVACAINGDQAIELVRSKKFVPDFVVSDYRLPEGETGTDLLMRLGEINGERVNGLIITGDTSEAQMNEARRAGYPVIHKPINPEMLCRYVNIALIP